MIRRDCYFSGAFPRAYLGDYFPGVATTPPLPPVPTPGGGVYIPLQRSRPPLSRAARASAMFAVEATARAQRRAVAASGSSLRLTLHAAPAQIHCGDEEACLAAALLS